MPPYLLAERRLVFALLPCMHKKASKLYMLEGCRQPMAQTPATLFTSQALQEHHIADVLLQGSDDVIALAGLKRKGLDRPIHADLEVQRLQLGHAMRQWTWQPGLTCLVWGST